MEIKKEFLKIQKERFVTFIDALMAIIMTIMVLEIKIPAVQTLTDDTLRQELHKAATPLIGFLVSFGTLTMIWISHNDLMKDIHGITKQFALLNFLLILVMALVPFLPPWPGAIQQLLLPCSFMRSISSSLVRSLPYYMGSLYLKS